jgi:hypothetical protein
MSDCPSPFSSTGIFAAIARTVEIGGDDPTVLTEIGKFFERRNLQSLLFAGVSGRNGRESNV